MKKLVRILLILVFVLIAAGLALKLGKQPEAFPQGSESATRLEAGPHEVHRLDQTFVDESRPTSANGDAPGLPVRRMEGSIWYPAGDADNNEPLPLIVYSHGFSSMRQGGTYLAQHLASLGYIIVAVDYPLTNIRAPGGPRVQDVVNQPGDVSFLIDTLLQFSRTPGHVLEGRVDGKRIGATGLSLGGMTTTLVSYHPTMRDPRIRAALSIAGPTSIFTETFFAHADLPFMMLAGDIDALVPYPSNAEPVPGIVSNSELVTIAGASHTGFAGPAAALRWLSNPDALGCWMVKRTVSAAMEDPWYDLLGTPEQGINHQATDELCQIDPLPEALNVLRQQMISTVVVSSFFQSQFAPTPAEQEAARRFLRETLSEELAEVSYSKSSSSEAAQ